MNQEEADHILTTSKNLKSWKISHNFSRISKFQKILQNCDKKFAEGNFEWQFETLNTL